MAALFSKRGKTMNITDICNMALNHIGKGTVTSVDDRNELGRTLKIHYDLQRQMLLTEYTWGFARRTEKLALLDKEIPGWDYVYAYPNTCLMVRQVFNRETGDKRNPYDIVNLNDNTKAIVCNLADAYIHYTYDAKDVELFSPDFKQALSYFLAGSIAVPLAGSATLAGQMKNEGAALLNQAKTRMAQERNGSYDYVSSYVRGRNDE